MPLHIARYRITYSSIFDKPDVVARHEYEATRTAAIARADAVSLSVLSTNWITVSEVWVDDHNSLSHHETVALIQGEHGG